MIGFGNIANKNNDTTMDKVIQEVDKFKGKVSDKKGISPGFLASGYSLEGKTSRLISFSQMLRLYKLNEWVRAIVDRTINKVVSFKPIISMYDEKSKEAQKHKEIAEALFKNPNKTKESWLHLRKKMLRDILIYDAAGLVKIKSKRGGEDDILAEGDLIKKTNMELLDIAGDTIYLNIDDYGRFNNLEQAYFQKTDTSTTKKWYAAGELIYMLDNPISGYAYGLSPLETLILAVTAELYSATYNRDFFKNNATPRLAVLFDNMGTEPESKLKRFRQYWQNELKGKPHRPFFMGTDEGQVRIEKIGMSNNDMQFMEYSRWLLGKILAVYKCQPFVLGEILPTTGKLNSEQQSKQWHEDAILPLLELEMYYYNTEIVWPVSGLGFKDIYYHYQAAEFDTGLQEKIDQQQIKDGRLTINQWRRERGMDEVPWGDAPWFNQSLTQPQTTIVKPTEKSIIITKSIKKKVLLPFLMEGSKS